MKINGLNPNLQYLGNAKDGFSDFKIGQIVKARISQMINDVLILEMTNGKLFEAKTTIPLDCKNHEVLQFRIKEKNENQLIIQPMIESLENAEESNEIEGKIINSLKELNIKPESEKINLVKKLITNNIPVNKENILNLIQLKSNFEKMDTLINAKSVDMNEKILNENIREVLKEVLKVNDSLKGKQQGTLKENTVLPLETQENSRENYLEGIKAVKHTDEPNINIQNISFDKIIFLLKNNFKVNIANVTNLNNLIFKDFTITKQTENLVELLNKNEETAHLAKGIEHLSNKIKNMIMDKKFAPYEIIKEMQIRLELVKQSVENINTKESKEILNNITNLKNSLDFINKMNQFQTYMQIPILLNDEHKNLDLFIAKENKGKTKIDPKDVKILLGLDTKTMDRVEVLVEIKEKNIICNFRVTKDEVKKTLSIFEKQLEGALILQGFKGVNIKYSVSNSENNILRIKDTELSNQIHFIDRKV